jgi:hypothetical protein
MVSFFTAAICRVFFLPYLDEMKRGPGDQNTNLIGKLVPPVNKFQPIVNFLFKCQPKVSFLLLYQPMGDLFLTVPQTGASFILHFSINCELPMKIS